MPSTAAPWEVSHEPKTPLDTLGTTSNVRLTASSLLDVEGVATAAKAQRVRLHGTLTHGLSTLGLYGGREKAGCEGGTGASAETTNSRTCDSNEALDKTNNVPL